MPHKNSQISRIPSHAWVGAFFCRHFGGDYNLALAHGDLGDRGNEAPILIKVLPIFERHFRMHHEYCSLVKTALNDAAE